MLGLKKSSNEKFVIDLKNRDNKHCNVTKYFYKTLHEPDYF